MQAEAAGEPAGVCGVREEPVQQEPHRGPGERFRSLIQLKSGSAVFTSCTHQLPSLLQEEITETKRKIKTMNNQVTRLRDEITGKELALAKDQQEHKRLEKDSESLKVLQSVSSSGKLSRGPIHA